MNALGRESRSSLSRARRTRSVPALLFFFFFFFAFQSFRYLLADLGTKFAGRILGERDGHHIASREIMELFEKIDIPHHEHARFAASGIGRDRKMPLGRKRFGLGWS